MPPKAVTDALARLKEISSQIEVAVIFDEHGKIAGASGASAGGAERIANASLELLREAERLGEGGKQIAQLDASTQGGSLFVVRDAERLIAATTSTEPTVGLVFYDLKSCLRASAAAAKKPAGPKAKAAPPAKKPPPKRAPARKSPSRGSRPSRKRDADS